MSPQYADSVPVFHGGDDALFNPARIVPELCEEYKIPEAGADGQLLSLFHLDDCLRRHHQSDDGYADRNHREICL